MFQITETTEAALTAVTNRTEKHGDEDVPAVSLQVSIEAANTLLDCIDPAIRQALYKAVEGQDQLPGVEPSTPVLRCNSFGTLEIDRTHEGWTLEIDQGIDEAEPMTFTGCKVDKFKVDAKQGGSVVLRLRIGTSDVDADRLGALAMHNGQAIFMRLIAPKPKAEAIDGTVGHPGAAAAAASQGDLLGDDPQPEAGDAFADAHASKAALDASGNNPFGQGGGPEDEAPDGEGSDPDAGKAKPARRSRKAAASVE